MTEQSRLMQQVEEIRRRAKVCPACGGTAKIEGESVEEANNERGYVVIEGKWTCYKCNGTGQVAAPDTDALCDALVTLAQAVEARVARMAHEGSCLMCRCERDCDEGDRLMLAEFEATNTAVALLRDGMPNMAACGRGQKRGDEVR